MEEIFTPEEVANNPVRGHINKLHMLVGILTEKMTALEERISRLEGRGERSPVVTQTTITYRPPNNEPGEWRPKDDGSKWWLDPHNVLQPVSAVPTDILTAFAANEVRGEE